MSDESLPVNIGNPDEVSIKQAAEEVIEISRELAVSQAENCSVKLVSMPKENVDEPKLRKPDISKAKRVLDWQPAVARKDGFRETVKFFIDKVKSSDGSL